MGSIHCSLLDFSQSIIKTQICRGGWEKICLTETESARFLLSYEIDLISVHNDLENIACII